MWNRVARGLNVLGLADVRGRTPIPMLVLNALHPLVPEELIGFMRGKRHVFVVEEGMPNFIERELKALAHEARLDVEIHGKELLSPHGEYVPALVIGGLRKFLTAGAAERVVGDGDRGPLRRAHHAPGGGARGTAAADRQAAAVVLHGLSRAAAVQRDEDPENAGARARRHPRGRRHRLHHVLHPGAVQRRQLGARLRHGAGLGRCGGADLRQARDVGDGRRRVLAQRPHQRRGQRGLQQAGLRAGHRGQQVHVGHRPAPQPLDRHQRAPRADRHDDPPGAARRRREVDQDASTPTTSRDMHPHAARGADHPRAGAEGDHRRGRVPARAPAPRQAARSHAGRGRDRPWCSRASASIPTCAPAITPACGSTAARR